MIEKSLLQVDTNFCRLLPEKLMREWCTLFTAGQPLYETVVVPADDTEKQKPTAEELLEDERKLLLDESDFNEYRVITSDSSMIFNRSCRGTTSN